MSDVTPEMQQDVLELINTEVAGRLTRQSAAGAQIDTKAIVLVGYVVAASSFLATQHPQPVLAGLAYAAYAGAAGSGILAYAVGTYQDVPDPRRLLNTYGTRSKSDTLARLAATRVEAFERNASKHERKAAEWKVSLAALIIGVALMLASIFAHTSSHGRSAGLRQHPATAPSGRIAADLRGSRAATQSYADRATDPPLDTTRVEAPEEVAGRRLDSTARRRGSD